MWLIWVPIILRMMIGDRFAVKSQNIVNFVVTRISQIIVILLLLFPVAVSAQNDSIDLSNPGEDYVIASVLIASPGEEIYSAVGHACLRLQCPHHDLDYVYSYEAEDANHNVLRFFAGKLNMGVRAVPTDEYVNQYAPQGRGVKEYVLNLPIAVKQRLWEQMDRRLEYSDIPYDYMNHSCAVSVLSWLEDAIDKDSLVYGEWPSKYSKTRKELAADSIHNPWGHVFLSTFIAGEGNDPDVSLQAKVMIPGDLVDVINNARVYGNPLVNGQPKVLVAEAKNIKYTWFTPNVVSLILLLIAIANIFLHWRVLRIPALMIGAMIGLFVTYLVFFSDLTCTEWNWLIVPFNPLPLAFWKWRKYWLLPLAAICLIWSIAMVTYPHQLVDDALIILAVTTALIYFEIHKQIKIKEK